MSYLEELRTEDKLSDDFNHMPMLERHIRATQINNFGKMEYLRVKDFKSYITKLKKIFCHCTPKTECFYCYNIKLYTGESLIENENNKV